MAFTDRLANRGSISTGPYEIENSLRVQHTSNEYLYRDNPTSGNRRTFTFSLWLKRASVSVPAMNYIYDQYLMGQGSNARFHFAGNGLRFMFDGNSTELEATQQLRDTSAWYHIVLAVDTTQATNTNRVKAYLNGNAYEWNNSDWPAQNAESQWMHDQDLYLANAYSGNSNDLSGYLADVVIIDGQQLTPSSFGETDEDSGIWKPKKFTGSFGDEGVWLKFDDSASMGADSSGNSNNFTLTNIDATNQTTDTPTNNFCTLNINDRTVSTTYDGELINGGLEYQPESGYSMVRGTMGMTRGKWYWEIKCVTNAGHSFGVCTANMDIPVTSSQSGGWITNTVAGDAEMFNIYAASHYRSYHVYDGTNWNSAAAWQDQVNIGYGSIMGFAWDGDNLDLYMSKEGSWTDVLTGQNPEGDPGSNTPFVYHAAINNDENEPWLPFVNNNYNQDMILNFGNPIHSISSGNSDANGYGNFEYEVPDGYYALCTKNIAEFG
jgi:hypothetical protein